MKSLLPSLLDAVDPLDVYALLAARPLGRPSGMHDLQLQRWPSPSEGRSGGLGGPADHRLFFLLRALTDVVLVGAGKTRTQGYGPVRLDDAGRAAAGFNIMNAPHWTPPPTETRLVELPVTFAGVDFSVAFEAGRDTHPLGDPSAPLAIDAGAADALAEWAVLDVTLAAVSPQAEPPLIRCYPALHGKLGLALTQKAYSSYQSLLEGERSRHWPSPGPGRSRCCGHRPPPKTQPFPTITTWAASPPLTSIDTVPLRTLRAFADHGGPAEVMQSDYAAAEKRIAEVTSHCRRRRIER